MSNAERRDLPVPNAAMFVACGTAIATLVPVTLHQCGVLKHLPDPPNDVFDSDSITESQAAHPLGIPDGLLGLASYGATFGLMCLARNNRTARKLLVAKLIADGGAAAFNVVRQVVQFGKLCSWCTGTAAATAGMLLAARPLLEEALLSSPEAVIREQP